jgi:hypothetical protein
LIRLNIGPVLASQHAKSDMLKSFSRPERASSPKENEQ